MDDRAKNITIHIPAGVQRGIKSIEIMNRTGQMLICQRRQIMQLKNHWKEGIQRQGVYILFNRQEIDQKPDIYIGEAENVINRLREHIRNKDFWERVFIFTNKDNNINKTHFKYLESRIVGLAKKSEEVNLINGNVPQLPSLSRFDKDMMDEYLDDAIILLDTLGFSYLHPNEKKIEKPKSPLRGSSQYYTEKPSAIVKTPSKERNKDKTKISRTPPRLGFPKTKDILAVGLMRAGDEIWFKNRQWKKGFLTATGKCEYEGRQMSLLEYAKTVSGWGTVNIYAQLIHAPSGKTIGELRDQLPELSSDDRAISTLSEPPTSYPEESGLKSNDRNGGAARTSRKPSRVNLQKFKDILAAGLVKAGDAIWFKTKPLHKAILTANGKCEYEGRQMNLAEYGKIVSGWKGVNIYAQLIHGPSGKTIGDLRDRLPVSPADARSKSALTDQQALPQTKKLTQTDSASGIRLYFDKPSIGVNAQGIHSADGFLVLAGSTGPREVKSYFTSRCRKKRENLIAGGEIELRGDRICFMQDIPFKSPSTAAEVISGGSQNGRVVWKDKDGKTLKEIQEESSW